MSENGKSDIKIRQSTVYSRFRELISGPKPEPEAPKPHEPTHEETLADALSPWVGRAPKEFWRELDNWVRAAHINARTNVKDHSDTTYGLGFEAAIEQVRDKFSSWRTTGSADSQGDVDGR